VDLTERLVGQTCRDFEVVSAGLKLESAEGLPVHGVAGQALDGVEQAVPIARGRFVVLAGSRAVPALRRATFVEQVIRLFWMNQTVSRFVLATVEGRRGPRLALLSSDETVRAMPLAVAWKRDPDGGSSRVPLGTARTAIEDFILHWQNEGPTEWRAM
jgi:hypothetical protein